jgi:hypothetical protein
MFISVIGILFIIILVGNSGQMRDLGSALLTRQVVRVTPIVFFFFCLLNQHPDLLILPSF